MLVSLRKFFPGFLEISYVRNTGAAMGLLSFLSESTKKIVFTAVPALAIIFLFFLIIKTIKGPFRLSLAYALILAGAVGNLFDRVFLGFVVDMITLKYQAFTFPTFNIADISISIAAIILVIDLIYEIMFKKLEKEA
jgi:signal peptidase II